MPPVIFEFPYKYDNHLILNHVRQSLHKHINVDSYEPCVSTICICYLRKASTWYKAKVHTDYWLKVDCSKRTDTHLFMVVVNAINTTTFRPHAAMIIKYTKEATAILRLTDQWRPFFNTKHGDILIVWPNIICIKYTAANCRHTHRGILTEQLIIRPPHILWCGMWKRNKYYRKTNIKCFSLQLELCWRFGGNFVFRIICQCSWNFYQL